MKTIPPDIHENTMVLKFLGKTVYGPKCVVNYGEECGDGAGETSEEKTDDKRSAKRKRKKRKLADGSRWQSRASASRGATKPAHWRTRLIDKARHQRDRLSMPTSDGAVTNVRGVARGDMLRRGRRLAGAVSGGEDFLSICLKGEGILYEDSVTFFEVSTT
ncbi:MAG: hypothetical protein RLN70_05740, partial [Rhodospirillaceae bacterium]